jgi:hypothetical protein
MRLLIILCVVGLITLGCQQPSAIELKSDPADEVEVIPLADADSTVDRPSIDTSGVVPADFDAFHGIMVVNRVKYDAGIRVDSVAFSRVFFADTTKPVQLLRRIVGYYGMPLGVVTLNGGIMLPVAHRVQLRKFQRDSIAGVEYLRDLTTTFQPNTQFVWMATGGSFGSFAASVQSPDNLTVLSPRGGSVLSRNENLDMRWTGQGDSLSIIISSFNVVTHRVSPLLHLKPRVNRNRVIIPAKILRALPRDKFFYVLTFVMANRSRSGVFNSYAGKVLVQSTSVYNCYVEIR